jgi:hypothetical protein
MCLWFYKDRQVLSWTADYRLTTNCLSIWVWQMISGTWGATAGAGEVIWRKLTFCQPRLASSMAGNSITSASTATNSVTLKTKALWSSNRHSTLQLQILQSWPTFEEHVIHKITKITDLSHDMPCHSSWLLQHELCLGTCVVCICVCYSIKSHMDHSEQQSFNDHLSRDWGTSNGIIEGDRMQC